MTTRELIETAKYYQSILASAGIEAMDEAGAQWEVGREAEPVQLYQAVLVLPSQLAYCGWMLQKMRDMDKSYSDKFVRWLCFIQGVFWAAGLLTVQEARDHIRPLVKK